MAVIDEIQLLKDCSRGWAWTRALLGIPADEIHLCGEAGAIDLVIYNFKMPIYNISMNVNDNLVYFSYIGSFIMLNYWGRCGSASI